MRAKNLSQRTLYPMMEPVRHPLPPRSRLYWLEPMGIGTPFTESLTSYVCRLAKAHRVTMTSLFEFILSPALGNKYRLNPEKYSRGTGLSNAFHTKTKNVNGVTQTGFDWVHVVESLTMRYDLRFLTLTSLCDVLHPRHLLRIYQAWCPECYEESRLNNQVIYTPISWFISAVEMCPRHLRRLVDRCPSCSKQIPALARRAFPGYCSRCVTWLGSEHKDKSNLILGSQIQWHTSVSRNVGELIATVPSLENIPTRNRVTRAVRACVDQAAEGSMTKLGKTIGKPKTSIWGWYHGTVRASLNEILRICYCLDISLVDLLSGSEKQLSGLRIVRCLTDAHPTRSVTAINYSKVETKLRELLQKDPPVSTLEASRMVGVSARNLYDKFPEICHANSRRYAEFRKAEVEEKQQHFREEVTEACMRLREQGFYPSNRRIVEQLGKPSYLCRRDVTAIAKSFR